MPIKNIISKLLVKIDQFSDYVPLASNVTGLVDLFQKNVVMRLKKEESIGESRYFTHLDDKSNLRCLVVQVPFVGNLAVGVYDLVNRKYRNKDFVREMVEKNGLALEKASLKFRDDTAIVSVAVKQNPEAIKFAGKKARNDSVLMKKILKMNPRLATELGASLKNNPKFMMEALSIDPMIFNNLGDNLKSKRVFFEAAVDSDPSTIQYASDELKTDYKYLLKLIARNPKVIKYFPKNFQGYRPFVREAARVDFRILEYIDAGLRNDEKFMREIIKENPQALRFAGEKVRASADIVKAAFEKIIYNLELSQLLTERDGVLNLGILKKSMDQQPQVFERFPPAIRELCYDLVEYQNYFERETSLSANDLIEKHPRLGKYFSEERLDDKKIGEGIRLFEKYLRKNPKLFSLGEISLLQKVDESLRGDAKFMLSLAKLDKDVLKYVTEPIKLEGALVGKSISGEDDFFQVARALGCSTHELTRSLKTASMSKPKESELKVYNSIKDLDLSLQNLEEKIIEMFPGVEHQDDRIVASMMVKIIRCQTLSRVLKKPITLHFVEREFEKGKLKPGSPIPIKFRGSAEQVPISIVLDVDPALSADPREIMNGDLKGNKSFVLWAVEQDPSLFQYISPELKKDDDVRRAAKLTR